MTNVVPFNVHRQQAIQSYDDWEPPDVGAALRSADNGDLRLVADICESMLGDDRIPGLLNKVAQTLFGLPMRFESAYAEGQGSRATEAQADWWEMFPEQELGKLLGWGILAGIGLAEKCWRSHRGRMLPYLDVWHPRDITIDQTTGQLKVATTDGPVLIAPEDRKWVVFTPFGAKRPWASGAWRGMSQLWMLKQLAIIDWGMHSDLHGQGLLHLRTKEQDEKRRQKLVRSIAARGRKGVVATGVDDTLALLEASADTWQMFPAQIERADKAFAFRLTGTSLTGDGEGGSYAKAQTLEGIEARVLQGYAEALATCMRDQGMVDWAVVNFGDPAAAPYPVWEVPNADDTDEKAGTYAKLAPALGPLAAAGVDVPELLKSLRIPVREGDDQSRSLQAKAIFKYHYDYGLITINEGRSSIGLPPIPGGDVVPQPIANPSGAEAGDEFTAVPDEQPETFDGASDEAPVEQAAAVEPLPAAPSDVPPGALAGQAFVDRQVEAGTRDGARAMSPDLAAAMSAIHEATSFDDLFARLRVAYRGMNPSEFSALLEKSVLLAELAGRLSILEDA